MICKFVKAIIQTKDEFLIRYLESKRLLITLFELYPKNSQKFEMFQSVLLEIISLVYSEEHAELKKQLDSLEIISIPLIKHVISHSKELKSNKIMVKDLKMNFNFFGEKMTNISQIDHKETLLNLNLLDDEEDDLDCICNEKNWNLDQMENENNSLQINLLNHEKPNLKQNEDTQINNLQNEVKNTNRKEDEINSNNNQKKIEEKKNDTNDCHFEILKDENQQTCEKGEDTQKINDKRPRFKDEMFLCQFEQDSFKNKKLKLE